MFVIEALFLNSNVICALINQWLFKLLQYIFVLFIFNMCLILVLP